MGKRRRRASKKKKMKKVLILEFVLLILIIAGAVLAPTASRLMKSYNKMQRTDVNDEEIGINKEIESENIEEYRNIAVFGVDSRDNSMERGLSDMIMIVSIHNTTKEIKVVSVYRDTFLMMEEKGDEKTFRKATEVYNKGGYELSLKMLNTNFDLNITDFVTVNYEAVYQAVDAVGGVEIDISEKEKSDINRYIDELNQINGTKSKHITKTGPQHLDGIQATAFGRIRKIDSDFNRTERQREVMMELYKEVKGASVSELTKLVDVLAPNVLTSLSNKEILSLAKDVVNYEIVDQRGFPFELTTPSYKGSDIVAVDNLTLSVKQLHNHLFADEEYEPSAKVKEISKALDRVLGRQENTKTTMYSTAAKENSQSQSATTKAGAAGSSKKKSSE